MPPKKARVSNILSKEQISDNAENTAGTVSASVSLNSTLNFDCLQKIFEYLPIKDRIAAERVSKQWNSVSKSSWGNFKSLNFKNDLWGFKLINYNTQSTEVRMKMLESVLSRCGKFLTSLNLSDFTRYDHDKSLNKIILNQIKTNCTNLKKFYMNTYIQIEKSSIPILKKIIQNLQYFKCKVNNTVTDEDLRLLFSSCNELDHLSITAGKSMTGDFLYYLNHEKIKKLDLSSFSSTSPMNYALQKFENLEQLFIGNLSDDFNFKSFEFPKTLRSLCLEDYDYHNMSLISKMTSLTSLTFIETDISDALLIKIAKNCSELEYLGVFADPLSDVTDKGVQALSALPKLENLRLSWLSDITGNFLKHFSKLKKLSVSACNNIDGKLLCNVLLTCKELEELSINEGCGDDEGECKNIAIDFFTSAKSYLKKRHFINNNPLRIRLFSGFVIVTSNMLKDSNKVKLFFKLYKKVNWESDDKSRKILDTNNLLELINKLNRENIFSYN